VPRRHDPVTIARRARRRLAGVLAAVFIVSGIVSGAPAAAQIVSAAPARIAVTIYRAPDRAPDEAIEREWLKGYALITEQRTVNVPSGRATIRFEGVAAGILPESAIVNGLPRGVREKNLDADLLSPRSLFARSFGRPVTVRREIAGKIIKERAIIRSGPDGAAILQTKDGFEAVNCGGEDDSLVYDSIPPGLAAKPTLSIEVDSPRAMRATITLSYLAWGFDWQANYIATMRADGRTADLTAWVTLASSDTTSFPAAETMVVAGKVKREDSAPNPDGREGDGEISFACFAHSIVISEGLNGVMAMARGPEEDGAMDIVVTGTRRMVRQEDLGDLKLYRVPDRTTVAAMAQKQIALLERQAVPVQIVYVADLRNGDNFGTPMIVLRAANRKDQGLGLPLPAGQVAVFEPHHGVPLLVGEGAMDDKAVGENLDIKVAEATQVTIDTDNPRSGDDWEIYVATIRNANPFPIRFETWLDADVALRVTQTSAVLGRRDGHAVWAIDVPANGTRELRYRLKNPKDD
jgi:hypothetical protein